MAAAVKKLSVGRITRFKNIVLGRDFDLSVAYVSRAVMLKLNTKHRKKKVPTDILSFQLSKQSGEIIICLPEVTVHARAFGMRPDKYLAYLFIHGMIHIKGHDHGRIMDRLEQKYCGTLGVQYPHAQSTHGPTNRSRH